MQVVVSRMSLHVPVRMSHSLELAEVKFGIGTALEVAERTDLGKCCLNNSLHILAETLAHS